MPRDTRSPHAKLLDFFRHAPIGEADLMFGLIKEELTSRKQHLQEKTEALQGQRKANRKVVHRQRRAKVHPAARHDANEAQQVIEEAQTVA